MKPIHKFNGGRGATLCHQCSVIITEGLTDRLYCEECMKDDFIKYTEQTRKQFASVASKYDTKNHLTLRTEIDNLLIAYDQLVEKVKLAEQYKEIIDDYKEVIDSYESIIKDLI